MLLLDWIESKDFDRDGVPDSPYKDYDDDDEENMVV